MAIIEVSGLRKEYAGRAVVDGVSFSVERGEIFGILGPNGAGKTTTVECVGGLVRPEAGGVRVAGLDPAADRVELTQLLGMQLQQSELQPKLKVREALELYSQLYRRPAPWRPLAERLGLTAQLENRFAKLSGGQQQRLFIALAMIGNPEVVILDELTTGLDPRGRREVWALIEEIRDSGVTILLVTHFMEEAQRLCDRVALIDGGRVVALDTPAGLVRQVSGRTTVSFVASEPLDHEELLALPGVVSVVERGGRMEIAGDDDTTNAVIALLARHRVIAREMRVTDGTLDDAYLGLTGQDGEDGEGAGNDGAAAGQPAGGAR